MWRPRRARTILLPHVACLVSPGRAAKILQATYAEHARAAALAGHDAVVVADPEQYAAR